MINAVLVFNNSGQPRLTKFYTQLVGNILISGPFPKFLKKSQYKAFPLVLEDRFQNQKPPPFPSPLYFLPYGPLALIDEF